MGRLAHGVGDDVVGGRLEDVVALDGCLGAPDHPRSALAVRRHRIGHELRDARVLGELRGAHRDELELLLDDSAVRADGQVEPAEERAHRAGLHDEDFSLEDRRQRALVRVAREDDVELRDLPRELARDGEAGVIHSHDEIRFLRRAELSHELTQAGHPGGVEAAHLVGRLALGGGRVGDADERHPHAAALERDRRREEALAGRRVVEVVREDLARELAHEAPELLGAVHDLPVAGHAHVEAERVQRRDDGFAARPRRLGGALERVASVGHEHRAGCALARAINRSLEARVAAHRLELGRLAGHVLGVRLELRVGVGEVQQRHVAKRGGRCGARRRAGGDRGSGQEEGGGRAHCG